MKKNYKKLVAATLLVTPMVTSLASTMAYAEEPPPLPPNPFSNLPANNDNSFNSPFEDDFDSASGGEDAAPARGTPPAFRKNGAPGVAGGSVNARRGNTPGPNNPGQPRIEPPNSKDLVENFDYPDAEILDVAKAIAKLTSRNFIYNPQDIKGRISIVSQTPITVADAWNAFLTAINMKGFALVPSGKYLRIERIANAKEKQIPIVSGKKATNTDEFITRVIPMRYIDATEFEQAFRLWMPREARMQAYAQTNTVIITDTSVHINRMLELIHLLDVAGYQESLVVIPVRNAPAKDLAKIMEQILNNASAASSRFGAARPTGAFGATGGSGRTGKTGGSTISKIIADDRTNALIVKANAAGLQEVRALVRRLDTKVAPSEGSGRLHVIRLQFASAEDLAKTLQTITTGAAAKTSGSTGGRSFPSFGDQAAVFQNEIKVAPDKATQSLVVTASPQDFLTLKKVVESLDVPRDQVFIEALIMEMNLSRSDAMGTSFVSAKNGIGLPSADSALQHILAGNPLAAGGFALGFKQGASQSLSFTDSSSGTATTSTYNVNSLNGLIELVRGNTDSNVVATPQIIALDNEEANFEISEEIKVPQNNITSTGISSQSYTSDKAVTSLKVTPQINKASNYVKLNIEQKLENFDSTNVPKQLQGITQGKNSRATTTKVIVQNEDTVVLSGLIRDQIQEVEKKVPVLGDIPVLGWLFKNSQTTKAKLNLLVFITPRIIKQYDSIRKVLNRKLDERDEFIRENLGSRDLAGRTVSELKSSLPELTVIEPKPVKEPTETTPMNNPAQPDRESTDDQDPNYGQDPYYYPENGGMPGMQGFDNGSNGMVDIQQQDNLPPPPVTPMENNN